MMKKEGQVDVIRRLVIYMTASMVLGMLSCTVASAQIAANQAINMSPEKPYSEVLSSSLQPPNQVIDVLLGRNTKGPYVLSWKPVNQNSETVIVNSRRLERGIDYTIDYNSGTLGFMSPVDEKSIIRVEYGLNPPKAVRNTGALVVPLTYDLLNKPDSNLRLTGLYKQGDPNQSNSSLTVLGLTGERKSKASQLSSTILFTPLHGDKPQEDSSILEQSAIKLAGATKTQDFELRGEFSRIGEQFAGAKEYKLKQGTEVTDATAIYRLSDTVSLSSKFLRTENLMPEKQGEATQVVEHGIVVDPKDSTKLTLTRKQVTKEQSQTETNTTTDRIRLERELGARVSAVALHENVVTDTSTAESRLTTNQLELHARVADNVSARTVATERRSSETGEEVGLNVDVEATPSKTMAVKLGVNTVNTEATGRDEQQTVKVQASPSSNLNVEVGIARRDSEVQGREAGQTIKVSSAPSDQVKLQLDYSNLDSEISGSEEKGTIRVTATPQENLKLSAALSQKETLDQRNVSKEARVEAKPFEHTAVGAAYKEVESSTGTVSRITELTAKSKPTNFAEFVGEYKLRSMTDQDELDTLNLALKLDMGGPFNFVGSYVLNPEEKGIVQRINSRSLGLQTDMGRLKLRSGYTLKDEYTLARKIEVREVGLDYRLSAKSLLTTSYRLDRRQDESALDTSVYSLGFTHRIGSDFHLYLGGKLTTYERDRLYLEDQREYEAEAKLGIKF